MNRSTEKKNPYGKKTRSTKLHGYENVQPVRDPHGRPGTSWINFTSWLAWKHICPFLEDLAEVTMRSDHEEKSLDINCFCPHYQTPHLCNFRTKKGFLTCKIIICIKIKFLVQSNGHTFVLPHTSTGLLLITECEKEEWQSLILIRVD